MARGGGNCFRHGDTSSCPWFLPLGRENIPGAGQGIDETYAAQVLSDVE